MSQAHNRITAYHWYLGSAFWRASGASTSFILTVQKVFIDHHALASARDTVGATWHRIVERPRPSDSNICTPGVAGSKPTGGTVMGVCRYVAIGARL